jgi:chromosome segregation ATPase
MAKVTKADLEQELKHLQSIIDAQTKEIIDLQQDKEDILADKNTFSKAEFEGVIKELESAKVKIKAYKDGDKHLIKKIDYITEQNKELAEIINSKNDRLKDLENWNNELTVKLKELRTENLTLIKKETVEKKHKHNERGAGRKGMKDYQEKLDKILELHQQGLSYSKIGQEVGLSKGYVCKLIKKVNEWENESQ